MVEEVKPKVLIRVPKGTPRRQVEHRPNEDPVDYCIRCWKEWMAGDPDRDLGTKAMRGLAGNSDCYGRDPEEEQQARDTRMAVATDAVIDSLSMLHRWAIYTSTGVGTAWRFPRADLLETYAAARVDLELLLRKNVCTAVLF